MRYQPALRYELLDVKEYRADDLPADNLVSALIGLENSRTVGSWNRGRTPEPRPRACWTDRLILEKTSINSAGQAMQYIIGPRCRESPPIAEETSLRLAAGAVCGPKK